MTTNALPRVCRFWRSTVSMMVLALLLACGKSGVLPPPQAPKRPLPPTPSLLAGIAQVDITPPPGLSLYGHGPDSRVASGVALRLRCQVFLLMGPGAQADRTEILALVPCELPAPSMALQRRIAEKVRGVIPLPANRVALLTTHTHFGPGHYMQATSFNGPFSGRRIGYDDAVVDFLAGRIGEALREAYGHLSPARVGWGTRQVSGISKNRSMTPLRRNRDLPESVRDALESGEPRPEVRAVEQRLFMLRIDLRSNQGAFRPGGAFAVYGVHPTVIGSRGSLYTGDLFGYATRRASATLTRRAGSTVLVGLANGLEGDTTSDRGDDNAAESQRLGYQLGDEMIRLFDSFEEPGRMSDVAPLQVAYRELRWPGAKVSGGPPLCEFGEVGTVSAGGADDHPTSMRVFAAARPGARLAPGLRGHCDPFKFPLLMPNPEPAPDQGFPALAPIMVARIGSGVLATAPAELTTVAGMRIAEAVAAARPPFTCQPDHECDPVAVLGLANEYLLYVATADEYELQHYEGAATVYGQRSAEFLRQQTGCLAATLFEHDAISEQLCTEDHHPDVDAHEPIPYTATVASVLPSSEGQRPLTGGTMAEVDDAGRRRVFRGHFSGPFPGAVMPERQIRVQVRCGESVFAYDSGDELTLRYDDRDEQWHVEWRPPADSDLDCDRPLALRVRSDGHELSIPFSPRCAAAAQGGCP